MGRLSLIIELSGSVCMSFTDSLFGIHTYDNYDNEDTHAYMADIIQSVGSIDTCLGKPLQFLDPDTIIIVAGDTSEWGFAWIDIAKTRKYCSRSPVQELVAVYSSQNTFFAISTRTIVAVNGQMEPKGFFKEYGPTIKYSST